MEWREGGREKGGQGLTKRGAHSSARSPRRIWRYFYLATVVITVLMLALRRRAQEGMSSVGLHSRILTRASCWHTHATLSPPECAACSEPGSIPSSA